jgi:hypothetical protein
MYSFKFSPQELLGAGYCWYRPVILAALLVRDQEDCGLRPAPENCSQAPFSKTSNTKKGFGVSHLVEYLNWKHEILSANLSITKKRKKKIILVSVPVYSI